MTRQVKAGIFGAGGFTGLELIGLLSHSELYQLSFISSNQLAGQALGSVQQRFKNHPAAGLKFSPNEERPRDLDVVFLATPNDTAAELAAWYLAETDCRIVDISGAHRIKDRAVFEKLYGFSHPSYDNVNTAVYGLTEFNRTKIGQARLVANPGCYPSGALLPLLAIYECLHQAGLQPDSSVPVIVDGKSGVSGAGGRTEGPGFSFNGVYENFRAYKVLAHQHEGEMAQELNLVSQRLFNRDSELVFTPHLLPLYRGILNTIYLTLESVPTTEQLDQFNRALAELTTRDDMFHLDVSPGLPELTQVQGTNRVIFSKTIRGRQLVLVSVIDNLLKGAAGQALQNANLMLGLDENHGLP